AADDLVAGIEQRLAELVEAAVGAGTDDDLLEGDAVACGERVGQPVDAAVGVAVELACGALHRLERSPGRWERPFVRGELDDPLEPELALDVLDRLARLVGQQRLDRGTDERRVGVGHGWNATGVGLTHGPDRTLPARAGAAADRASAAEHLRAALQ